MLEEQIKSLSDEEKEITEKIEKHERELKNLRKEKLYYKKARIQLEKINKSVTDE